MSTADALKDVYIEEMRDLWFPRGEFRRAGANPDASSENGGLRRGRLAHADHRSLLVHAEPSCRSHSQYSTSISAPTIHPGTEFDDALRRDQEVIRSAYRIAHHEGVEPFLPPRHLLAAATGRGSPAPGRRKRWPVSNPTSSACAANAAGTSGFSAKPNCNSTHRIPGARSSVVTRAVSGTRGARWVVTFSSTTFSCSTPLCLRLSANALRHELPLPR